MYVCVYVGVLVDDENDNDDGGESNSPIHTYHETSQLRADELSGLGSHMDHKECLCAVCQCVLGNMLTYRTYVHTVAIHTVHTYITRTFIHKYINTYIRT